MSRRVTAEMIEAVRDIVDTVKHIVDHPDDVSVNIKTGPYKITVELYTHEDDVGQVVGKNGHVIASYRSILTAIAGKNRTKVMFDFITEEDNKRNFQRSNVMA